MYDVVCLLLLLSVFVLFPSLSALMLAELSSKQLHQNLPKWLGKKKKKKHLMKKFFKILPIVNNSHEKTATNSVTLLYLTDN